MKAFFVFWFVLAAVWLGAFGVLMVEDRMLGVPLPYSLFLAFAAAIVVATVVLAIAEKLRALRPVQVVAKPVRVQPALRAVTPRGTEGVVLFDLRQPRERAA